jgi:putative flippase GtrA
VDSGEEPQHVGIAVGTIPSFELNRRWVWRDAARRSLFSQILPFCALSFTGLVVFTVAVGVAADQTSGWSHWGYTAAVLSANVAAYGTLWIVQYQLLDRVLFRNRTGEPPGRAGSLGPNAGQMAPPSDGPDGGTHHVGSSLPLVSARGEQLTAGVVLDTEGTLRRRARGPDASQCVS